MGHLAKPPETAATTTPRALVLCPDLPHSAGPTKDDFRTLASLADRVASDAHWFCLGLAPRGFADSKGDFSVQGWIDDIRTGADHLVVNYGAREIWLGGLGLGGLFALICGADDERVKGVASFAAPAEVHLRSGDPKRFLSHARNIGVIRSRDFPADEDAWCREVRDLKALDSIAGLNPRPVLIVHGADDEIVPPIDARALADSVGAGVDLRLLPGAGHQLRHDPRAIALLLGWLSRQ